MTKRLAVVVIRSEGQHQVTEVVTPGSLETRQRGCVIGRAYHRVMPHLPHTEGECSEEVDRYCRAG
jgi:hypothetical protein